MDVRSDYSKWAIMEEIVGGRIRGNLVEIGGLEHKVFPQNGKLQL